jgi:hypothetical protein
MSSFRVPGVLCQVLNLAVPDIDAGTLARTATATPGTVRGPAEAGTKEPEGFVDASYASITSSVGNGFCVPLVQLNTSVGNTATWRAGTPMTAKPEIAAGTVIATFNSEGRYESKSRGNHAAFFVEYTTQNGVEGIVIYDQYREWPDKEQKAVTELEVQQQKLLTTPGGASPQDAAAIAMRLADARKALDVAGPEVDDKGRRFRRKLPGKRFIGFGRGTLSNNANSYSVVVH